MIFEIINPSDKCNLEASDHEVASIACCLIGEGKDALSEDCLRKLLIADQVLGCSGKTIRYVGAA